MKKTMTRVLALLALVALLVGVVLSGTLSAFGAEGAVSAWNDVPTGHWAKSAIDYWTRLGIVRAAGDRLNPGRPIPRGELLAMLVWVNGYTQSKENEFADLRPGDRYYQELLQADANGILSGSFDNAKRRLARATAPITRAEAAAIYSRVFAIDGADGQDSRFRDRLPVWARSVIFGMEAAGYMSGKAANRFGASDLLTRGEAIAILGNILPRCINQPGEYSGDVRGNLLVNSAGVVLKDLKISGNLYLAEGIGQGDVILENVTVAGMTFVRGGGQGKLRVQGGSLGKLVLKAGLSLTPVVIPSGSQPGTGSVVPGGSPSAGGGGSPSSGGTTGGTGSGGVAPGGGPSAPGGSLPGGEGGSPGGSSGGNPTPGGNEPGGQPSEAPESPGGDIGDF